MMDWLKWGCGCCVIALLAWSSVIAAEEKKSLTLEERKQLQEMLSEYRKLSGKTDERLAVIEKVAPLGFVALRQVEELISKEIQRGLTDYRPQFTRAAKQAFASKGTEKNIAEITELRGRVLTLASQPELSKEQIVQVSDPALNRLKELLLVDREAILKLAPALAKPREALLKRGEEWDAVQAKMREAAPPPAKAAEAADTTPPPVVLFADYLIQEEELALAFAMPMDPETRKILLGNTQIAAKLDPEEGRCILDCNIIRSLLGLRALAIDPLLVTASRGHSADMRKVNFFAHESPVPGKKTPWDRAALAGTSGAGENIAYGTSDGVGASRMWWHSPGHHKNMVVAEWVRIGVGREDTHWTQMFGR